MKKEEKKVKEPKQKSKKQIKKEKIKAEQLKIEERIDSLIATKKTIKDKVKKKAIKKEIKELKHERNEIGKKDTFLRDVLKEMHLVRWPKGKELLKYSIASFVFVAMFALYFYGIDVLFALVKDLIS